MADYALIYRTTLTVTVGTSGVVDDGGGAYHKDFTLPDAVNVDMATLNAQVRERRIGDEYGATVELADSTTLRMRWFGALVNDEATSLDEIISVHVEVNDQNALGNELKELRFQLLRVLGYLGENMMQDQLEFDLAGNLVEYRLRTFDTRAHAEDATPDLPDAADMETGELARVTMSQDIEVSKNDRALLMRVLTDIVDTPGVD